MEGWGFGGHEKGIERVDLGRGRVPGRIEVLLKPIL